MGNLGASNFKLVYRDMYGAPALVPGEQLQHRLDVRVAFKVPDRATIKLGSLAIHVHAFYVEELRHFLDQISDALKDFALFVTTDNLAKCDQIHRLLDKANLATKDIHVLCTQGCGRNVIPLLLDVYPSLLQYEVALHLHTKRSRHFAHGKEWAEDLLDCLVGSVNQASLIRRAFACHPLLGLVMPRTSPAVRDFAGWGGNLEIAQLIGKEILPNGKISIDCPLVYPAGMMFWFRPRALQKLHLACKHLNSIPLEPLDDDGTPLHALERLVAHSCEAEGYKWALCSLEDEATQLRGCSPYDLSVLEPNPEAYLQATAWLARDMRNKERDYLLLSDELRGKVQIIAQKDLQIAASEALIWLQNQWVVKLTYFWVRKSKALLRKGLSWAK